MQKFWCLRQMEVFAAKLDNFVTDAYKRIIQIEP